MFSGLYVPVAQRNVGKWAAPTLIVPACTLVQNLAYK